MMVRKLKKIGINNFFNRPVDLQFGKDLTLMLGLRSCRIYYLITFEDLHKKTRLLPIRIKSIEEGSMVPYKIPCFCKHDAWAQCLDWLVNC
jgi:hypothetical protein